MSEPILRATEVDLAGLFTVLADHLYSTPQVAVRELLQNAHDACVRRRMEDPAAPPARIRVAVAPDPPTLILEDNGAGLTEDEIVKYLATVGRGYTRELRASSGSAELIGLFGLGFLSAFVVAERVTVRTTSYAAPTEGHVALSREAVVAEPAGFEPITVLPVEASEASDVRGLLWIQDGASYGASDNRNLSVFVRGMLLDDDARDLLPPWAGFVGGVIASDVLSRHNEALLGAALASDALFDVLADDLQVPTTEGDLTLPAVRARTGGRFYVGKTLGNRFAVAPFAHKVAARRGGDVLELGTQAANREVFTPVSLSDDAQAVLARCLGDLSEALRSFGDVVAGLLRAGARPSP